MNRMSRITALACAGLVAVFILTACAATSKKEATAIPQTAEVITPPAPTPAPAPAWEGDSLTTTSLNIWPEGAPEYRALWITRFEGDTGAAGPGRAERTTRERPGKAAWTEPGRYRVHRKFPHTRNNPHRFELARAACCAC
jgi:hypothetical protein